MMRRGTVGLALALLALGACSSDDDDDGSGGDDVTDVRWDLRQPTSTRDLGADADEKVTVAAPRGEQLDVEVRLPGVTVRGEWDMVTAVPFTVELSGDPPPVADVTLYDDDVTTIDDLRAVLARFERDWGFTEEDCAAVGEFVADAEARLAEAGGDPMGVDWGLTPVVGFAGPPHNGVQPGIVVRLPPPTFSTFTRLTWDPAADVEGDEVTVGGDDDGGTGTEDSESCIPPGTPT